MSDTYIPSGEESAQEQQFLQALVGQIQSRDACAIPKFATELFCNFMGDYQTLAVNPTMLNATVGTAYLGMQDYRGLFITTEGSGGPSLTIWNPLLAGNSGQGVNGFGPFFSPSPTYFPPALNWGWPNPTTQIISQSNNYPNLAFYRQSFTPSPFYVFMPKWMKSFKIGMRIYDNLGNLQLVPIATKTNAKWQDATINSSSAPDGSYVIETLSQQQFQDGIPNSMYYIGATILFGPGFSSQFETTRKYFIVNSFNENPSGGSSIVTASLSNYRNIGIIPAYNFLSNTYAVEHWTTSAPYDGFGAALLPPKYPTPSVPDVSDYPRPNQTYQFSLPAPPSLPFRRYFRFIQFTSPSPAGQVFTGTFSVNYPAGYPADPATFTLEPASFDIAKVTIANYSAVNPQPAGFPTPPPGVPTFNSLTLATMPLIGVDITQPL